MRAVEPSKSGTVERDGLHIAYEVFGDGETTVVFTIDNIVESRAWKAQVPWLSRRARVITIDPRGNGKSDRTTDPAQLGDRVNTADMLAVMDELGVESAVLAGVCNAAWWSLLVAAEHPDRVRGLVLAPPTAPFLVPPHPWRTQYPDDEIPGTDEGWAKLTHHHMLRDWRGTVEFFFGEIVSEPHSSKVIEDCVGWALQTDPQVMCAEDWSAVGVEDRDGTLDVLGRVRCPSLVIYGDEDRCQPPARFRAVAEPDRGGQVEHALLPPRRHGEPPVRRPVLQLVEEGADRPIDQDRLPGHRQVPAPLDDDLLGPDRLGDGPEPGRRLAAVLVAIDDQ